MSIIDSKFEQATKGINESWLSISSLDLYNYIMSLPDELKIVYCIVVLDNQIYNGGLHQYFTNGYGQFADYTIKALLKIGAKKKASVLKEAFRLINIENVSNEVFALRLLDLDIPALFKENTLDEILDGLDKEYEEIKQEDIQGLLDKFLK